MPDQAQYRNIEKCLSDETVFITVNNISSADIHAEDKYRYRAGYHDAVLYSVDHSSAPEEISQKDEHFQHRKQVPEESLRIQEQQADYYYEHTDKCSVAHVIPCDQRA